ELAKTHGVSLTVVREAAVRLASERFLEANPQQGFSVWPLSIPHLLDLTRVRVTIESLAIRESAERGDIAWEADLVAAHHPPVITTHSSRPRPQTTGIRRPRDQARGTTAEPSMDEGPLRLSRRLGRRVRQFPP